MSEEWRSLPRFDAPALCAETDPDLWHPEKGGSARLAKSICGRCEARDECLAYALGHGLHNSWDGIWGGATPRERQRMDSNRSRRQAPINHGTESGYNQHRRRGEQPCFDCQEGNRLARRRRKSAGAA